MNILDSKRYCRKTYKKKKYKGKRIRKHPQFYHFDLFGLWTVTDVRKGALTGSLVLRQSYLATKDEWGGHWQGSLAAETTGRMCSAFSGGW